ncbi:MAG: MarR family transcriptional regulator, partial [Candidatus Hodarchaeales archaeon]
KDLALEKQEIMTKKYNELIDQLKEREKLAMEKESLNQQHVRTLQEEIEKKNKELEKERSQLERLETELKEKNKITKELQEKQAEALELQQSFNKMKDEFEIQKYELERAQAQINTMVDDDKKSFGTSKAIKTFLSESESGRVLNQLMNMQQASIDDLATITGINTYNVQQVIEHLQDLGIVTLDKGTRRARILE